MSLVFGTLPVVMLPEKASACCFACAETDCDQAVEYIDEQHEEIRERYEEEFDKDLDAFEEWMIEEFFEPLVVTAMADMATQMGAVAMQYTHIIGSFLDAQTQMETQRLYRKMQFEAHQDYHPSEDFCWFGTNVRSLAGTESKARYNTLALSRLAIARQTGVYNTGGAENVRGDYEVRWQHFAETYCDVRDNNAQVAGAPPSLVSRTGLQLACDHDGAGGSADAGVDLTESRRINRDIDYIRLIDEPRTIDVDFTDGDLDSSSIVHTASVMQPHTEEDVISLSKNLYGHKVLSRELSTVEMGEEDAQRVYAALRSVVAKRTVAQASFNAIVGLKSAGTSADSDPLDPGVTLTGTAYLEIERQTQRYMAAVMQQIFPVEGASLTIGSFDFSGGNIFDLIGYSPSYYSQLEILAKRIYQNPDFYANLYDTPANVARKKVAMQAIELMVDRAIYESQLRREMSISVLLASRLRASHRLVNKQISIGEQ
ncbi:MAG: hypothetical protein ACRBDL_06535 [Alphaproteobacteria bacterium]